MDWSGGCFNFVGHPKMLLVAPTIMVRAEVHFRQEKLLKNLKSRWKRVPGSRCSVETLG